MSISSEGQTSSADDKLATYTLLKLKNLSSELLRLHKLLLDQAKADYEAKNGRIQTVSTYFQLVIDDPHFAWLRKISALIALIDEAVSVRRQATETEAGALLNEARVLLDFEDADEGFNDKFHAALQNNPDAVRAHNSALRILG